MRGDGVGVGLAVDGTAVVGTGIDVAVLGEGLADGGAHELTSSAMSRKAAGPIPAGQRARLAVRFPGTELGPRRTRPVNGSRATRSPVPPAVASAG